MESEIKGSEGENTKRKGMEKTTKYVKVKKLFDTISIPLLPPQGREDKGSIWQLNVDRERTEGGEDKYYK